MIKKSKFYYILKDFPNLSITSFRSIYNYKTKKIRKHNYLYVKGKFVNSYLWKVKLYHLKFDIETDELCYNLGKYKNYKVSDIKENDYEYYNWFIINVRYDGFFNKFLKQK